MATCRLLCFPYAGGGPSAYLPWLRLLPQQFELWLVSPPGGELRPDEPAETQRARYVAAVAEALGSWPRLPMAFFGHSFGAITAFEVARACVGNGRPPRRLFVAGKGVASADLDVGALCRLPDEQFLADVRERYDGPPRELDEAADLRKVVISRLRSDLALLSSEPFDPTPALPVEATILFSPEDRSISADGMDAWRRCFLGTPRYREYRGGHFFINTARESVVGDLRDELVDAMSGQP